MKTKRFIVFFWSVDPFSGNDSLAWQCDDVEAYTAEEAVNLAKRDNPTYSDYHTTVEELEVATDE